MAFKKIDLSPFSTKGKVNQHLDITVKSVALREGWDDVLDVYTEEWWHWPSNNKGWYYDSISTNLYGTDSIKFTNSSNSFYYFVHFLGRNVDITIRWSSTVKGDKEFGDTLVVSGIEGSRSVIDIIENEKAKWDKLGYTWDYLKDNGILHNADKVAEIKDKVNKDISKDDNFNKDDNKSHSSGKGKWFNRLTYKDHGTGMHGYYTNIVDKDNNEIDKEDSRHGFDIEPITKIIYPKGLDWNKVDKNKEKELKGFYVRISSYDVGIDSTTQAVRGLNFNYHVVFNNKFYKVKGNLLGDWGDDGKRIGTKLERHVLADDEYISGVIGHYGLVQGKNKQVYSMTVDLKTKHYGKSQEKTATYGKANGLSDAKSFTLPSINSFYGRGFNYLHNLGGYKNHLNKSGEPLAWQIEEDGYTVIDGNDGNTYGKCKDKKHPHDCSCSDVNDSKGEGKDNWGNKDNGNKKPNESNNSNENSSHGDPSNGNKTGDKDKNNKDCSKSCPVHCPKEDSKNNEPKKPTEDNNKPKEEETKKPTENLENKDPHCDDKDKEKPQENKDNQHKDGDKKDCHDGDKKATPKDDNSSNGNQKPKESEKGCICTCDKECCKTHPDHIKDNVSTWDAKSITIWDENFTTSALTITSVEEISESIFLPCNNREKGLKYYKVNVKESIIQERGEIVNYLYVLAHLFNGNCVAKSTDIKETLESYINHAHTFTFKKFFYDDIFNNEKRVRYYALESLEESPAKKEYDTQKELLEVKRNSLLSITIEFSSQFSIGNESIQKKYEPQNYKDLIKEIKVDKFDLAEQTIKLLILLLATEKAERTSYELINKSDNEASEITRIIEHLEKLSKEWVSYSNPLSKDDNPLYLSYLDNFSEKKELVDKLLKNWKNKV